MDLNPLRNYIKNGENPVDSVRDMGHSLRAVCTFGEKKLLSIFSQFYVYDWLGVIFYTWSFFFFSMTKKNNNDTLGGINFISMFIILNNGPVFDHSFANVFLDK